MSELCLNPIMGHRFVWDDESRCFRFIRPLFFMTFNLLEVGLSNNTFFKSNIVIIARKNKAVITNLDKI